MKPIAYAYKLPHHSKWHGVRFVDSSLVEEPTEGLITEPLYAIDTTKFKLVPLHPDDKQIKAIVDDIRLMNREHRISRQVWVIGHHPMAVNRDQPGRRRD